MDAVTSLTYFVPELILLGTAFAALLLDLFIPKKEVVGLTGLAGVLAALAFARCPADAYPLFYGFFLLDPFSFFFKVAALLIVAVTLLAFLAYRPRTESVSFPGEFTVLFLFMAFALILMGSSNNLLMIFLSLEFVSVLSYLLTGFLKKDSHSKEAALKYLLFGSVASGTMLYGMSILFGLTGAIDLNVIHESLVSTAVPQGLVLTSLFLILVGLGFKISMAPFHMWAPDVYEGALTPVTAFLTVGPKALGFAVLVRLLHTSFLHLQSEWSAVLVALSILTMTLGNVVAISQTNIKRLLGYSSIAQAGYILMGLAVSNEIGIRGVLVYLIAYAFTNLGAFLCVILVSNHCGTDEIDSYAGLSEKSPFLAFALTVFLLSLAGIPPLAGFIGKFYVFSSAIQGQFITLAVAAALNSAVAAFYYFKVVRLMYLAPAPSREPVAHPAFLLIPLWIALIGTVVMGVFPNLFIQFVERSLIL
ncbi:MAG: NADH-quinone oxidoreductase subunit N [Candidatus Omnitrophica bacterium]|nr:NADH-quinone oxidoreductase subunit N [Candidatus Omnitrophota bacterium]